MVVFISPELEHVVLALRPPGSPLHIIRRPLNSMLVAQVHCPKGSVSDPDLGVFWIRIRNPDPDPGA